VQQLVDRLRITPREDTVEQGARLYTLALQHNFTRGRRTALVTAAAATKSLSRKNSSMHPRRHTFNGAPVSCRGAAAVHANAAATNSILMFDIIHGMYWTLCEHELALAVTACTAALTERCSCN
jgi:hypothetical protein